VQVVEGFLEALLNDVFRVLVISCYSERDSEDAHFVPHKEFIKAICIPRFGTSHKPASSLERMTGLASAVVRSPSSLIASFIFLVLFYRLRSNPFLRFSNICFVYMLLVTNSGF
jgi:hypothetical protein